MQNVLATGRWKMVGRGGVWDGGEGRVGSRWSLVTLNGFKKLECWGSQAEKKFDDVRIA